MRAPRQKGDQPHQPPSVVSAWHIWHTPEISTSSVSRTVIWIVSAEKTGKLERLYQACGLDIASGHPLVELAATVRLRLSVQGNDPLPIWRDSPVPQDEPLQKILGRVLRWDAVQKLQRL